MREASTVFPDPEVPATIMRRGHPGNGSWAASNGMAQEYEEEVDCRAHATH
jgi:hypothetical protein